MKLDAYGIELYNSLISELGKVKTKEELTTFNEDFRKVLLELVLKMIGNYLKRLSFMIQYLQYENLLLVECDEAKRVIDEFKVRIQKFRFSD
jgi:retron-type reverse transcriptase